MKSAYPGESIRFILRSFHSTGSSEALIETLRFTSSGSKSEALVPSSTLPRREMAPLTNNAASANDVLPVPPCPSSTMFLIFSVEYSFIRCVFLPFPARWHDSTAAAGGCQPAVCWTHLAPALNEVQSVGRDHAYGASIHVCRTTRVCLCDPSP